MNNTNIPELVQLPKPYINMDSSINTHLVNILNTGLDNLDADINERFSENDILMMRPTSDSLQFDFPGDAHIYYANRKEDNAPHIYFYATQAVKGHTIYVDERAEKALDYIKDYYDNDIIVYPYEIISQDMHYRVFNDGTYTTIAVYGIHEWLSLEEFVLFSECAKEGEIIPRDFYHHIMNAHGDSSFTQRESGYYNTGNVNEQGFPEFVPMTIFRYTNK